MNQPIYVDPEMLISWLFMAMVAGVVVTSVAFALVWRIPTKEEKK